MRGRHVTRDRTSRPLAAIPVLGVSCLIGACSTTSGEPATAPEPLAWAPGEYLLEASVPVRQDGMTEGRVVNQEHLAELTVTPGGELILDADSGVCIEPSPTQIRQDQRRRRKSFLCGDATYRLRPGGDTVAGELSVLVQERIRREIRCSSPRQAPPCYRIALETTRKQVRIRVLERPPG